MPDNKIEKTSVNYFEDEKDWRRRPKNIKIQGEQIYYLFDYYPGGHIPPNEFLKTANRNIKALKSDAPSRSRAVEWLARELSKRAPIDLGWYWSYVPSSDPKSRFTGARSVAQIMSARNITSPKPKILERKKIILTKEEQADGTIRKINRSIEEHQRTLGLFDNRSLKGMKIVLLDDVITNGSTMIACRNVLLKAGVKDVIMIGLGLTLKNRA